MTQQQYKNEHGEKCYSMKGIHCIHCGKDANQLAHRIPQNKMNLKKYGYKIIHHWMNRDPVCSLECNSKSSISNHPMEIEALVRRIKNESVMWEQGE